MRRLRQHLPQHRQVLFCGHCHFPENCTWAQAADVNQDGTVRAAAGHALPHGLAAVAWVELLRVHAPLPHVQAAGRAPIPQQLVLRTNTKDFYYNQVNSGLDMKVHSGRASV